MWHCSTKTSNITIVRNSQRNFLGPTGSKLWCKFCWATLAFKSPCLSCFCSVVLDSSMSSASLYATSQPPSSKGETQIPFFLLLLHAYPYFHTPCALFSAFHAYFQKTSELGWGWGGGVVSSSSLGHFLPDFRIEDWEWPGGEAKGYGCTCIYI